MSIHARAADAAYLRRLEHAKRLRKPHAPVGTNTSALSVVRSCRCCGYHVCSCKREAPVLRRTGGARDILDRPVCFHGECSGGLVCRKSFFAEQLPLGKLWEAAYPDYTDLKMFRDVPNIEQLNIKNKYGNAVILYIDRIKHFLIVGIPR